MEQFIDISNFSNDDARVYLESIRWADGVTCPHCQSKEYYKLTPKKGSKSPVRQGVYKCKSCRKQFTVTVKTIFEDSHIPLNKWLIAIYLIASSKKGISSNQLHRMLGVTYKSAWFMSHRIRYAMAHTFTEKMSGVIEVDETYIGGKRRGLGWKKGKENKIPVVSLVDRDGEVRSKAVPKINSKTLKKFMKDNIHEDSWIMTDESHNYKAIDGEFSTHQFTKHARHQYVKHGYIYTNTVEGYFSLLKRGINGTFHHISEAHLHRYLSEFDFRYTLRKLSDAEITPLIVKGFEGKRLTYRGIN